MTDAAHGSNGPAVAIVGIGALFPGAGDAETFWRNIVGGVDAISQVPPTRWDPEYYQPDLPAASDRLYCRRGGFVDDLAYFDPAPFGIMPFAAAGSEPDQMLALRVATEVITDIGGPERLPDRSRVGVILGRGGYLSPAGARLDQRVRTARQLVTTLRELVPDLGEDQLEQVRSAFQERLGPERPEAAIGLVPNLVASRIANRLDLQGPAYTVDAACASSLLAVDHAVSELATGRCDLVLAGGVHHTHDITFWSVFTQLGALSRSEQIRPFDQSADGLLIGEGTGMIALKRLADAERDGDRIYAVVRGTGISSDGRASSLMAPRTEGQVLALQRAWRTAGLDPTAPGAIGLLEAHGTATPAGDEAELATLTTVFGLATTSGPDIGIGSVKSMIGHTMPAAGIAGLIKAVLAVYHGVLPPTLHCDEPHRAFAGTRFAPVTAARPWKEPLTGPRRAAVNAFGFGGINAHVIVEQAPGPKVGSHHTETDRAAGAESLLLLSGATVGDIAAALDVDDDALLEQARRCASTGTGPVRLAIAAPDARRIALARKIVARGTPWRGRSDVYFEPRRLITDRRQVAFLFPGLEPTFAPRIEGVAAHFGLPPIELSSGTSFVEQAVNVVAVSRLLAAAMHEIGIEPGLLAGHSLGEWTAMVAGGMYRREDADAFIDSVADDGADSPDVVYAALGCSAADAVTALGALHGPADVVVTHDNCPHQSVVCGHPQRIDEAIDRLRQAGVLAQVVPIRTGFHSPVMADHLGPVYDAFHRLPPRAASVPVWSATSVDKFPDSPEQIRALVIRHLVEPVRFRPLLERLHAEGVRAFVQIGPGSLPGFVADTLRGSEHLVVETAVAERDSLVQLWRVAAALWAAGLNPRFDRLPGIQRPERRTPAKPLSSTAIKLDLGNRSIMLGGALAPLVPQPAAATSSRSRTAALADSAILAEFDALVAEMTAHTESVVQAWAQTATNVVALPTTATTTRVISLETMPELIDHSLIATPAGWHDPSDGFPIVPITGMLEIMADAARELLPGRVVIGWSNVRAMRWLVAAPATTVTIDAVVDESARDDAECVTVTIAGHATGTVLLSGRYPHPPERTSELLDGERPAAVSADRIYRDRRLFHGPRFAGITELVCDADWGARAVLVNLPTRGALFDAVGQVIGHWAQVSLQVDRTVFPVGIDSIELYGPPQRDGALLKQTAWIREATSTTLRADSDLVDERGALWARVQGWTNSRIAGDERNWQMQLHPDSLGLGTIEPGGWCLVEEQWPDTRTRELIMRNYMCAVERDAYERLDPMHQRRWLLGRIAAKDAVRNWLWANGTASVYTCEFAIDASVTGRPYAVGLPNLDELQIAHANTNCRGRAVGLGVAMVATHAVGISITAVGGDTTEVPLSAGERDLIHQLPTSDPTVLRARFAAAKEAAAQLANEDGPLAVAAVRHNADQDADVTVEPLASCPLPIHTRLITVDDQPFVVAWTHSPSADRGDSR
ncbi:type I polyketide synthase [Antrihabitans sp. YC2-6]|uniref:type I polyketide synthase n=1 Tax=Antrihabitans sp. YC2-6 TaxID=2799498 RepID=UPI0018F3E588|nr:beta-ketoacyl synthase N-terminal-like domain-containing protein [Antrihabitans sp. YC2-6]MBJ8348317.1 polyketide synthase dehydratase domain-containing protein [Antrihabitans sp. YC2-6]